MRDEKIAKWTLRCVEMIFILMFLSNVYQAYDTPLKLVSLVLAGICFIWVSMYNRISGMQFAYLMVVLIFLLVEFIQGYIRYDQGLFGFFSAAYYYVFVLLLPVFSFLINHFGRVGLLVRLEKVAVLIATFMLACSLIRFFVGIDITGIERMRSGMIRINAPFLVQLAPLICLYLCFKDKNKAIHTVSLIINISAIIIVYQSRLVDLLLVLCLSVLVLNRYKNNAASFYLAVMTTIVVFVMLMFGPMGNIINSFSVHGEYSGSTVTRIYETDYYLDLFRDNVVNGAGLIEFGSPHYSVISGSAGAYYIDDVGIIGALAAIGLWVVPLFLVPLILLARNVLRVDEYDLLGWPVLMFVLGTSFTTLIVFPYFDPCWPLLLTFFARRATEQSENFKVVLSGFQTQLRNERTRHDQ